MSEYIPFSSVVEEWDWDEEKDGPYPFTPEQVEAATFFHKMDWEGGIDGLYGYGGAEYFPAEVREFAEAYGQAYDRLHEVITAWGKARGVVY